ncbi:MAG: hypothetical protein U1F42_03460 [Candidatus Competibacteraceae bacterium]
MAAGAIAGHPGWPQGDLQSGGAGRCHQRAGALYTPCPPGTPDAQKVIVDGDLVTNPSWHATEALIDTITDLIVKPPAQPEAVPATPVTPRRAPHP